MHSCVVENFEDWLGSWENMAITEFRKVTVVA